MWYGIKYKGVFEIPEGNGACVITLTDEKEERALSIVTSRELAMDLKEHEKKLESVQTNVLDILYRQYTLTGSFPAHGILVDAVKNKGYRAFLQLTDGTNAPAKVDQAILFAVMSGVPMEATKEAFMYFSTPYCKNNPSVALPILGLPKLMLQKALDQAIGDENYEMASVIRDEMKRREEEHSMLKNE